VELDLLKAYGWIVDELARCRPTNDSMADLVDLCQAASPHPDWSRLRSLPYGDLSHLSDWVSRPFRDEPHARPLRGLWFGLFNPSNDDDEVWADIYVSGSERFEMSSDNNEWAVDPDWWPDARYASSPVLADIYRIAYREGGLGNDAEYPLCLSYGAFAVRELLSQIDPALVLGNSDSLGVAVGFDSGDFVLIGEFKSSGLVTST
jgi:hypothetical protein